MNHRTTFILLVLFFGALMALWWADHAGWRTEAERRRQEGRVLPELIEIDPLSIVRIEIEDPEAGPIHIARTSDRSWHLTSPVQTLARADLANRLVLNLRNLTRYRDSGPIPMTGDLAPYGFDRPGLVVRLFRESPDPVAVLELGKVVQDRQYVRADESSDIEVVDVGALSPVLQNPDLWRERRLLALNPYDVQKIEIKGLDRALTLDFINGRWRLQQPIQALADPDKVNATLADLTRLGAIEGPDGIAADDVTNLAAYGLDPPRFTVSLTPAGNLDPSDRSARVAEFGNPAPNPPGTIYARRSNENDVLIVPASAVESLGVQPNDLRSRRVLDLQPDRIQALRIQSQGTSHVLVRDSDGWHVQEPTPGPADEPTVGQLLNVLATLETAEFLPISRPNLGLDAPTATFDLWEASPDQPINLSDSSPPNRPPDQSLILGRFDANARAWFGQLGGDPTTALVLPATLNPVLPSDSLAYRNRTFEASDPRLLTRIRIDRDGESVEYEQPPGKTIWSMVKPVMAPADPVASRLAAVVLAHLRADRLVVENPTEDQLRGFGLNTPALRVSWTLDSPIAAQSRVLLLGAPVPGSPGARFARLDGIPMVFTLASNTVEALAAELREKTLMAVPADQLARLVLTWKDATYTATRQAPIATVPPRRPAGSSWSVETRGNPPLQNPSGLEPILGFLTNARALRFEQHGGAFPSETGLDDPRLQVEVQVQGVDRPIRLHLGNDASNDVIYATLDSGNTGTVVLLPRAPFSALLPLDSNANGSLPDSVFAEP